MDNLQTLFEKGEFELILDLTSMSQEPEDLLYRASAYLALNKGEEALAVLTQNRDALFAFRPLAVMRATIEARLALGDPIEAYRDLNDFKNRPYVSQECEEYMKAAEEKIALAASTAIKKPEGTKAEDLSKKPLNKEKPEEMLAILGTLSDPTKLGERIDELIPLLSDEKIPADVRSFALFLLVNAKYNKPVDFKRRGKIFRVVPKDLPVPYIGGDFPFLVKAFEKDSDSPDAAKVAQSYLATYILVMYPEDPFAPEDVRLYELAFLRMAYEALRMDYDLAPLAEAYKVDKDKLDETVRAVENLLLSEGRRPF